MTHIINNPRSPLSLILYVTMVILPLLVYTDAMDSTITTTTTSSSSSSESISSLRGGSGFDLGDHTTSIVQQFSCNASQITTSLSCDNYCHEHYHETIVTIDFKNGRLDNEILTNTTLSNGTNVVEEGGIIRHDAYCCACNGVPVCTDNYDRCKQEIEDDNNDNDDDDDNINDDPTAAPVPSSTPSCLDDVGITTSQQCTNYCDASQTSSSSAAAARSSLSYSSRTNFWKIVTGNNQNAKICCTCNDEIVCSDNTIDSATGTNECSPSTMDWDDDDDDDFISRDDNDNNNDDPSSSSGKLFTGPVAGLVTVMTGLTFAMI